MTCGQENIQLITIFQHNPNELVRIGINGNTQFMFILKQNHEKLSASQIYYHMMIMNNVNELMPLISPSID